jgi:hypothetical protein
MPRLKTYYEVEIMLGTLDESHIIRTIEYWDLERQRRPTFDHRAVIVAERITARFFNVLRLLNRSVPMIAVQLSVFRLDDDAIVIHPVTVLDIIEEIDPGEVPEVERVDRAYREKKANPGFLKVIDNIASLLRTASIEPRLTYNRHHVALGATAYNFCWFYPRTAVHCSIEIRLRGGGERRDAALSSLVDAGIDASPRQADLVTFSITTTALEQHSAAIGEVLRRAAEAASARASL